MKKRRHQVVVDVTFSKPVTEKEAVSGLQLIFARHFPAGSQQIPWVTKGIYAFRYSVKAFSRVYRGRIRRDYGF